MLPAPDNTSPLLVIACGALAREIVQLSNLNNWQHLEVQCLDAELHNRPQLITERVREKIVAARSHYENIFVAYADCGTGGALDSMLQQEGIDRLPGAHCYSFFAGEAQFTEFAEAEPATFYLTDFLARHFERLIVRGLKLDQHPELQPLFFGNYRQLLYLSQTHDSALLEHARAAAKFLNLTFQRKHVGYGSLASELHEQLIAVG